MKLLTGVIIMLLLSTTNYKNVEKYQKLALTEEYTGELFNPNKKQHKEEQQVIKNMFSDGEMELFEKFRVPEHLRQITKDLSEHYNIKLAITVNLVYIESTWGHNILYLSDARKNMNGSYDIGLGQLNSQYHDYFEEHFFDSFLLSSIGYNRGAFDPYDDISNLQVSIAYLDYLLHTFNNCYEKSLQAYNCGLGNVFRGTVPEITKKYSNAILNGQRSLYSV